MLIKRINGGRRKDKGTLFNDWHNLDEYSLPPGMIENLNKNKYKDEIKKYWKQ